MFQISGVKSKESNVCDGSYSFSVWIYSEIGALATIVPQPVLGGAMISMFGMVLAYGVKMLGSTDFAKQENLMIIACSVGLGLEGNDSTNSICSTSKFYSYVYR